METLTEVQRYLNRVPFINYGGCGIAALAIGRWLKKQGVPDSEIAYCYLYESSGQAALNLLREKRNELLEAPAHVMVKYHGECIDSSFTQKHLFPPCGLFQVIDEFALVDTINRARTWNHLFDRTVIFEIAATLDIDLHDVLIDVEMEV